MSSEELCWAGRTGSLLTGCRFMAQRPTLGPKEGFSGDYRLLPAGPTFSHLIWGLTENRGYPSSSPTLLRAFVFWTFACLLGFALRADVSHKPSLVREESIGAGRGCASKLPRQGPRRSLFHHGLSCLLAKCWDAMPCRGLKGSVPHFDRMQSSLQIPG